MDQGGSCARDRDRQPGVDSAGDGLDLLLLGVEEAVGEARRQAAASQAHAATWQQRYEQERQLRKQLEEVWQQGQQQRQEQEQLRRQELGEDAVAKVAADAASGASSSGAAWVAEDDRDGHVRAARSVSMKTAVVQTAQMPTGVPRRHTAPALRTVSLGSLELLDQLSSTATRLEALRQELEADLEAGKAADGSLALSRLASLLHACSFLREASAAACTSRRSSGDMSDGMNRQDSSAAGEQEVALHDDGAAGVGATAAAAVSVALAQSWAAAAGARQASFRHAAAAEGAVRPGKARFKLVAAVPRSYRKPGRPLQDHASRFSPPDLPVSSPSHAGMQAYPSRHTLADTASGSLDVPGSPAASAPAGSLLAGTPFQSAAALDSLAEAEPTTMDDAQEATWRASGQHLKLQWMSQPSSVLVVWKPTPEVLQNAIKAVAYLLHRGLTVWVEPEAWGQLMPAVQQHLSTSGSEGRMGRNSGSSRLANGSGALIIGSAFASMDSHDGGEGDTAVPAARAAATLAAATVAGAAAGTAAAVSVNSMAGLGAAAAGLPEVSGLPPLQPKPPADRAPKHSAVDLHRQLRTWEMPPCGCPPAVPSSVGHQVDLVLTLGGDGTVLWTCGLFAAGAVPPLVPLAMGSLGFMTPFEITGHMETVLSRVIGTDRGMPLMLRHRLQCRIIRGDASTPDLAAVATANNACLEEFVVLNEVVIDRGMTAQLCNLQCYVDNAHVTVVQGDGLIVATPTGSTAYNLAAGGSMVHPAVPCFLFTPICPHSLSSRPLILPEHVNLRIKVPLDSRSSAYCSFDGRSRQELRPGDSVIVSMSCWPAPMVCNLDASHDWFLSMREGLNWNVRKVQAGRGH